MTTTAAPDSEQVTRTLLATAFTPTRVGTQTPADLQDVLPFIEVSLVDGHSDTPLLETAIVDVDVYADTYDAAMALAKQVQFFLSVRARGQNVGSASIRNVDCTSIPRSRPWADTAVFRVGATYSVGVHGH